MAPKEKQIGVWLKSKLGVETPQKIVVFIFYIFIEIVFLDVTNLVGCLGYSF